MENETQNNNKFVYVSVKGKDHSVVDGVYMDKNIAMLKKCKECIVVKMILDETKFIS
jgi:hypothetical protein